MLLLILFPVLLIGQVSHDIMDPRVVRVKYSPQVKTAPPRHKFRVQFPSLGYLVQSRVFETTNGLLNEQVHDSSFYNVSSSCEVLPSKLSLDIVKEIELKSPLTIESSCLSSSSRTVYLLVSNLNFNSDKNDSTRSIEVYTFNTTSVSSSSISLKGLGLNLSEQLDIAMMEYDGVLFVTDGIRLVGISTKNNLLFWEVKGNGLGSNMSYEEAAGHELLKLQLCHISSDDNTLALMLVWDNKRVMLDVSAGGKSYTVMKVTNAPEGKLYYDVISDNSIYYALVEGALVVYRKNQEGKEESFQIALESKICTQLDKFQTTLHVICRESHLRYVAEFYISPHFTDISKALILNRYYTEVEDAKTIFRFGIDEDPKILISGDEDLMLTAYGINRKVLLEMNQPQQMERYSALGIEQIYSIDEYSSFSSTYAIGVGTKDLTFFRINQSAPMLECSLERHENILRANILVAVNVTSCLSNGDIEQLESICQMFIPYNLYISSFEVDTSKGFTLHMVIFSLIFVLALVFMGCAFKCKTLRNKAIAEIQKKIDKLKKKKELKPI